MERREDDKIIELIELLHQVDQDPEPFQTDNGVYDMYHPTIERILILANDYLTVGPDVLYYRNKLELAGYRVYPGEVDSFGWLTAYFQMKKSIILFG